MSELSLVDTNVLVYLFDSTDRAKHEKAKKFFSAMAVAPHKYVIALQNLRELAAVLLKKTSVSSEDFTEFLSKTKDFFSEVIMEDEHDIKSAFELSRQRRTRYWDALICSTMQRHGIRNIYTENISDFKPFKDIVIMNPLN